MVDVAPLWLTILGFIVVLIWGTGTLVLGLRANTKGKAYLQRVPPIQGVPPDMYMYWDNPWLPIWRRPVWRIFGQPQEDAELEQLRQDYWERTWYVLFWTLVFPGWAFGMIALLR